MKRLDLATIKLNVLTVKLCMIIYCRLAVTKLPRTKLIHQLNGRLIQTSVIMYSSEVKIREEYVVL